MEVGCPHARAEAGVPVINVDVGIGDAIKLVCRILVRRNTREEGES